MHKRNNSRNKMLHIDIQAASVFLDMPNTSAKLYGNPFMQYRVMARTKQKPGWMDKHTE